MANETDPDYDKVIYQLDERNRIVLCSLGIQWILQNRTQKTVENPKKGCYYAKSFVRTREGLKIILKRNGFSIPEDIETLPRFL